VLAISWARHGRSARSDRCTRRDRANAAAAVSGRGTRIAGLDAERRIRTHAVAAELRAALTVGRARVSERFAARVERLARAVRARAAATCAAVRACNVVGRAGPAAVSPDAAERTAVRARRAVAADRRAASASDRRSAGKGGWITEMR